MRRLLAVSVVVSAGVAVSLAMGDSTTGAPISADCTPTWRIVPSPRLETDSELLGVTALAPRDAWAVGYRWVGSANGTVARRTLTAHWDGRAWKVVASPDILPGERWISDNVLTAISPLSGRDIWAVGSAGPAALIEHWNGTRWHAMKIDPLLVNRASLNSVVAITRTDVSAVGTTGQTPARPLVAYWNGRSWKPRLPFPSLAGELTAVAASSARDVWAVGGGRFGPLVAHWDGSTWKSVRVPPGRDLIMGLAAAPSGELWAVTNTAIFRWDGRDWRAMFRPRLNDSDQLTAIAAAAADDIWAVGWGAVLHWDGRRWRAVPPVPANILFNAVAMTPDGNGWAVGRYTSYKERIRQAPVIARLTCRVLKRN